ncbi:MAG TPA: extracellular solute-binding protein [Firmicutes bacterium]|uniref:Extracellular solute-binding protein n=1 Tax=Capillibacterium thermochitinicola TaxID=2699427 RepID=A0A8J6HTD3_9FIRM|nr:extracellular solute-binding protein [Capillibacterium thermochitinicola]HHW11445.1 extracellular solute-binding protein [Bacillota bacterium]
MKKIRLVLGLLVLCLMVSMATFSAPTTLRVIMGLAEEEWAVMREHIFPAFEKEYNVKIEAYQAEAQDTEKILEARVRANKMDIDLITQDNMRLATLVDRGLVEDLSEYRTLIPTTVYPSLIEVGEFNGKLYFLPYRPNVEIAFYNSAKFNQYGLKPPTTWDELFEVAKFFYEKEGVGRVAIKADLSPCTAVHLFDFCRAAGGDPVVLNDKGCFEAYSFLQKLWPYLSPDSKTANWNFMNTHIATESVYLGQNWPFGMNVIVRDGGKKEVLAYNGWRGPVKESHVLGGEVIGIPKGAPNKALAIEFAKYLMSREVQEKLTTYNGWPAVRSDAYGQVAAWQKPYFDAINQVLAHAEPRPNLVYYGAVEKAMNEAFRECVIEGAPVKPTLEKWAKYIQDNKR